MASPHSVHISHQREFKAFINCPHTAADDTALGRDKILLRGQELESALSDQCSPRHHAGSFLDKGGAPRKCPQAGTGMRVRHCARIVS